MADKVFQAKAYLSYWLNAVDEHSLHSPFFFDFYTRVVRSKELRGVEEYERLRRQLLQDKRQLSIRDLGARMSSAPRTIGEIANASISPLPLSQFYSRLIHQFKSKSIVELGTSFGINTLYLAKQPNSNVMTFEGPREIAEIARLTFEFASAKNIRLIEGDINVTLPEYLQGVRKIDFVLMDANHRYEPTVRYFRLLVQKLTETSVMVIDDIHYSRDMERAWRELKNHELVHASADLFRCGVLFFDPSLNKQHVILQV